MNRFQNKVALITFITGQSVAADGGFTAQ
jgi:hypothetical protein